MAFDDQPELEGATLRLRPLRSEDRAALYAAASDPAIWKGHPAKTRHERAVFDPYFDMLLAYGGTLVVLDRAEGQIIGCSRYYTAPARPGSIAIGYTFLARSHWGGATNREMKMLMFDHAFAWFDEIWLDIGPDNIRSQKATAKLGAREVSRGPLDLGTGEVQDYVSFVITRHDWRAQCGAGPA